MKQLHKGALTFFFCAAIASAQAILQVSNAASLVPAGMANGAIAQGSRFILTGTGIGPGTPVRTNPPFPTSAGLAGYTVQVTAGATAQAYVAPVISVGKNVVQAIMPSNVPPGNAVIVVSLNGQQGANSPVTVVPVSFGIYTLNGLGSGPAQVSDADGNEIDITNAAHSGDTVTLLGTGLGKISGDDSVRPQHMDLNTGAQVFVGNQPATLSYGGRAGGPGVDRIDFVVPDGVSGCHVSLAVDVGGIVSNFATMPIATAGQSACSDPDQGISAADVAAISSGSVNVGTIGLSTIGNAEQGTATFGRYDMDTLVSAGSPILLPSVGSCAVYQFFGNAPQLGDPVQPALLDAGPMLAMTGPNGNKSLVRMGGAYQAQFRGGGGGGGGGGGAQPSYLAPGSYTISSVGGADVGAFQATLQVPQPVTWTNMPPLGAALSRSSDLAVTWSGTGPTDVAIIFGLGLRNGLAAEFLCAARGSDGQFTVPALVLANIPATILPETDFQAGVLIGSSAGVSKFTAPGLDVGYAGALILSQSNLQVVAFQ